MPRSNLKQKTTALPPCSHANITEGCKDCKALRDHWYAKIQRAGFNEIEDVNSPLGFLKGKEWSGDVSLSAEVDGEIISTLDFEAHQEAEAPLVSISPQNLFRQEDEFFHSEDFKDVCRSLNLRAVKPAQVRKVWEQHLGGASIRETAASLKLSRMTVQRTLKQLTERMDLMSVEDEIIVPPTKVIVRPYMAQVDEPFLYASWRNSLWYDEERTENPDKFFRLATKSIRKVLAQPTTTIMVAVQEDSPLFILGYAVIDKASHVLWVYVKADYRNQGLASLLCQRAESFHKPMTKIGKAIAKNKNLNVVTDEQE